MTLGPGPNVIEPLKRENLLSKKTLPHVNRIRNQIVMWCQLFLTLIILFFAWHKSKREVWGGNVVPWIITFLRLSEFWCLSGFMKMAPRLHYSDMLWLVIIIQTKFHGSPRRYCLGWEFSEYICQSMVSRPRFHRLNFPLSSKNCKTSTVHDKKYMRRMM